ncbi:MAG: hypothetical protein DMF28_06620 [Verrucomicrobia bacterium]|nr:MAG: hypothetical protein DMF28_06620 [Verrucomicrobiota bacterium]
MNFAMSRSFDTGWKGAFHGHSCQANNAHRDDGKRYVVDADEKLSAFLELEAAISACGKLA